MAKKANKSNPGAGSMKEEFVSMSKQALFGMLLIFIMLVATMAILLLFGRPPTPVQAAAANTAVGNQENSLAKATLAFGDYPALGNENAGIIMVEFTDYQCPFCARFYNSQEQEIIKNYIDAGKVKFYVRDFPGFGIHDKADESANAARCANEQGKFWEMHNKIFEERDSWEFMQQSSAKELFKKYAAGLGLNAAQFNACFASLKYNDAIINDMKGVSVFGFSGTPSFVISVPKNKVADFQGRIDAIKKGLPFNYYAAITLLQDDSNYLVMISGEMPYDVFKKIFDAGEN